MFAITHTRGAPETIALGRRLAERLPPGSPVLLFGPLGAGKTHFIKGLAEGWGADGRIKSPTFAYLHSYASARGPFHHYDLYRLEAGASTDGLMLEEHFADPQALVAVEWADRLGRLPERYVRVELQPEADTHQVSIAFAHPDAVPDEKIEAYFKQWRTPAHVQAHCRQVALVAQGVAEAMARVGRIVDINLVVNACLLHDLCRVCDFRTLDRAAFKYPVSQDDWSAWVRQREEYKGRHHADVCAEALKRDGYFLTAEAVRLHASAAIVNEPGSFDTVEKKLVYYADKRVAHDRIVSLAERFREGRERYGHHDDAAMKKLYEQIEQRTLALEHELFEGLDQNL